MPMSPNVEMIASICSASTRSSGRWSLISEYVRKPRSLPSLIRFLRRVRRVSASSLGSSAGISQASLPPRRPPRPPLPFDLTSATFASRSSSACFALLTGVFACLAAALASSFGAGAFAAALALGAGSLRVRAATLACGACFFAGRLPAWERSLRRLTALAFFLAARTFFTLDLLRFCILASPGISAIGPANYTMNCAGLGEKPKIVPKGRTFKGFDLFLPSEFEARNRPRPLVKALVRQALLVGAPFLGRCDAFEHLGRQLLLILRQTSAQLRHRIPQLTERLFLRQFERKPNRLRLGNEVAVRRRLRQLDQHRIRQGVGIFVLRHQFADLPQGGSLLVLRPKKLHVHLEREGGFGKDEGQ